MEGDSQGVQPSHAEQRRRFALLLTSRAAVVTALLGSTIFFKIRAGFPGFSITQNLLYATVAAVYLLTAGYLIWLRVRKSRFDFGIHMQVHIVVDVLVATVLVYVTGGVESPFSFFYALPVINTAVFYPRLGTFLTAGLSCLLLGALFVLENQGILPVDLEGRIYARPSAVKVAYRLILNFTMLLVVALLSSYLGVQLRKTGRRLKMATIDLEMLAALNRDIISSLRSGLLVINPEGQVSLLNPVAEQIVGWRAQEAFGQALEKVFPCLTPWLTEQALKDPALYHRVDLEHQRPLDQKIVPIGLTLSTLQSPDGKPAGVLVHMQDLTQQRKMEATVKRAEKLAALGTMAAAMAHEIRNPLASISGSVQVMKGSQDIGAEDQRLMEIILRETGRLDSLLNDFLAFARPKEPLARACQLKELVHETASVFERGTGEAKPRVEYRLDPVTASVDPDQIRQVLWNLLANAAQAAGKDGLVTIRLSSELDGDGVRLACLAVADDGPGIEPEHRERIFEPFFTTKDQGSGLGLATVGRIVEAHGGTIQLECPQEGGSQFTIRLPGVSDE